MPKERLARDIDESSLEDAEVADLAKKCLEEIYKIWASSVEEDYVKSICIIILEAAEVMIGHSLKHDAADRHLTLSFQQHARGGGTALPQVDEAKELRAAIDRHNARILYALEKASEITSHVSPEGLWPSNIDRIVEAIKQSAPQYMQTTLEEVTRRIKLTSLQLHNSKGLQRDD